MSTRLTKIDELTRPDHTFLEPEDQCFYLGEYTSRRGFAFSAMNNLINNLRKPMSRRGLPEWRYKESAFATCATMLREALNDQWLSVATLVPIPSSSTRGTADYDDRMPGILRQLSRGSEFDIRELAVMTRGVQQSHLTEDRVSIEELIQSMSLDPTLLQPPPQAVGIFDDILTTGRHFNLNPAVGPMIRPFQPLLSTTSNCPANHPMGDKLIPRNQLQPNGGRPQPLASTAESRFKAVQAVIRNRFPEAPIVGVFVARRAPDSTLPGAS